MSKRLAELARQKQDLIAQCTKERLELAGAVGNIKSSVTLYGAVLGLGRILLTHPWGAAAISSLLASGYARKLTRSGTDLLKLLSIARPIWAWWNKYRSRETKPV
jgi:hypothetical protein